MSVERGASGGSAGPSLAGSPLVTAADQAASMLEGVSSSVATQMENLSASTTQFADRLLGVEQKTAALTEGYDACHSACVSSF